MRVRPRSLFAVAAVALSFLVGAPGVFACGDGGYTYAGISSSSRAFGIGAVITPLPAFNVLSGHVAGWVGVGGPRQGPGGTDEWLQVGFSGFPQLTGNNIYYELMLPNGVPRYHQVAANLPVGRPARVAVLEMHRRPNVWRVWVDGAPASQPIRLPGSHGRWAPIATAESWDGGTGGSCNGFLYSFHQVSIARAPGGSWQPLAGGYTISSPSTRIARNTHKGSFVAAEGDDALRTLASFIP
jgi:hypothetical protein